LNGDELTERVASFQALEHLFAKLDGQADEWLSNYARVGPGLLIAFDQRPPRTHKVVESSEIEFVE
jgi:hypothetical protein